MNPHDWRYSVQRLHPFSEPHRLRDAGNSENVLRSKTELDLHHERLFFPNIQPPPSSGSDRRKPSLPIQNREEFEPGYSEGQPMVLEGEDAELLRRKKELQEIEERIMYKKAFIAVKTIGLLEKKSSDKQLDTNQDETLKERVKAILQRHPYSLIHKIQQPRERLKSSLLSEGHPLHEQHPLKLRVKMLMKHRRHQPVVLPASIEKTPDVPLPRHPLPADGNKKVERGFDRFLEVLNKGTDANLKEILSSAPLPSAALPSAPLPSAPLPSAALPSAPLPSAALPSAPLPPAPLPSASRSVTPPAKGASRSDEAFERFLKLLNKGTNVTFNEMVSSVPPPFSHLAPTSPADSGKCDRPARNLNNAVDSTVMHQEAPALQTLPRQSSSSTNEESKVEIGFERFLSVLNKGVDINLLSKIVMDNKEEPSTTSAEKNKSEEPLGRKSSCSNSGAPLSSCIKTSSAKTKTDKPSPQQSLLKTAETQKDEGLKKQVGFYGSVSTDPQCGSKAVTGSPILPVTGVQTGSLCGSRKLKLVKGIPHFLVPINTFSTPASKNTKRKKRRKKKKKGVKKTVVKAKPQLKKTVVKAKPQLKPLSVLNATTFTLTTAPLSKAPLQKAPSTVTSPAGTSQAGQDAPKKEPDEPKPVLLTEEDIKANLRKKLQEFNEKAKQAKLVHRPSLPDNSLSLELS